jgi:hypothetical protein
MKWSVITGALAASVAFTACGGGTSSNLPAAAQNSGNSPITNPATSQKPVMKTATTGVNAASNIYVDDGGAMKRIAASADGAAAYTTISMPSSFSSNPDPGQFAAMNVGGNTYIAYVNPVGPGGGASGQLTVCQVVESTRIIGHKIIHSFSCNPASVLGSSDVTGGGPVSVVWDNALSTLATLNASTGRIGMWTYTGGDTLAEIADTTWTSQTDDYIAMAADPLSGGLWFVTGASFHPFLMSFNDVSNTFSAPAIQSNITVDNTVNPTALDVNNNYDLWVGNAYGTVYNNANGTEQLYAPGEYCSAISSAVVQIGSDTQNGYIAGYNLIEVYADSATEGGGCPQPSRTITGFSNIEGMTIL